MLTRGSARLQIAVRSPAPPFVARGVLVPVLATALGGCAGPPATAKAPVWEPEGQTKATIAKSRNRPLIVEWPAAERATLESSAQRGIVAVRYSGDSLELLSRCRAAGSQRARLPGPAL